MLQISVFKEPLQFCHFANGIGESKYLPVVGSADISKILTEALENYNEVHPAMNLVLFEDAISHVLRINRIIESPRGNALLIGVGGSGKQSLSKLAAYIGGCEVFQVCRNLLKYTWTFESNCSVLKLALMIRSPWRKDTASRISSWIWQVSIRRRAWRIWTSCSW